MYNIDIYNLGQAQETTGTSGSASLFFPVLEGAFFCPWVFRDASIAMSASSSRASK